MAVARAGNNLNALARSATKVGGDGGNKGRKFTGCNRGNGGIGRGVVGAAPTATNQRNSTAVDSKQGGKGQDGS